MTRDADRPAAMQEMIERLMRENPAAVEDFFQTLFARAPEMRVMFRDEDIAAQGARFLLNLAVLPEQAGGAGAGTDLRALGSGHAAYGVRPEHFGPLRDALLEMLEARLGEGFDAGAAAAWAARYDRAAAEMMGRGARGPG